MIAPTWVPARVMVLLTCLLAGCEVFGPSYDYGRVEVIATDLDGAALAGVRLTLYTGLRHMSYGETDGRGRHLFRFVPRGEYGVEAGAPPGYRFPDEAMPWALVTAEEGRTSHVTFEFQPLFEEATSLTRVRRSSAIQPPAQ